MFEKTLKLSKRELTARVIKYFSGAVFIIITAFTLITKGNFYNILYGLVPYVVSYLYHIWISDKFYGSLWAWRMQEKQRIKLGLK